MSGVYTGYTSSTYERIPSLFLFVGSVPIFGMKRNLLLIQEVDNRKWISIYSWEKQFTPSRIDGTNATKSTEENPRFIIPVETTEPTFSCSFASLLFACWESLKTKVYCSGLFSIDRIKQINLCLRNFKL